jgi:hypothetical protein
MDAVSSVTRFSMPLDDRYLPSSSPWEGGHAVHVAEPVDRYEEAEEEDRPAADFRAVWAAAHPGVRPGDDLDDAVDASVAAIGGSVQVGGGGTVAMTLQRGGPGAQMLPPETTEVRMSVAGSDVSTWQAFPNLSPTLELSLSGVPPGLQTIQVEAYANGRRVASGQFAVDVPAPPPKRDESRRAGAWPVLRLPPTPSDPVSPPLREGRDPGRPSLVARSGAEEGGPALLSTGPAAAPGGRGEPPAGPEPTPAPGGWGRREAAPGPEGWGGLRRRQDPGGGGDAEAVPGPTAPFPILGEVGPAAVFVPGQIAAAAEGMPAATASARESGRVEIVPQLTQASRLDLDGHAERHHAPSRGRIEDEPRSGMAEARRSGSFQLPIIDLPPPPPRHPSAPHGSPLLFYEGTHDVVLGFHARDYARVWRGTLKCMSGGLRFCALAGGAPWLAVAPLAGSADR